MICCFLSFFSSFLFVLSYCSFLSLSQILLLYHGCGRETMYLPWHVHHLGNGVSFCHRGTTIPKPCSPYWLRTIRRYCARPSLSSRSTSPLQSHSSFGGHCSWLLILWLYPSFSRPPPLFFRPPSFHFPVVLNFNRP